MTLLLFVLVLLSVCLQAFSQLLLRKAMMEATPLPSFRDAPAAFALTLGLNVWLWAGLISCVLSVAVWLAVLAKVPVSVAYPMLSLGYVVAAAIGVTWLGETVTVLRAGGILIIIIGVAVIARSA